MPLRQCCEATIACPGAQAQQSRPSSAHRQRLGWGVTNCASASRASSRRAADATSPALRGNNSLPGCVDSAPLSCHTLQNGSLIMTSKKCCA